MCKKALKTKSEVGCWGWGSCCVSWAGLKLFRLIRGKLFWNHFPNPPCTAQYSAWSEVSSPPRSPPFQYAVYFIGAELNNNSISIYYARTMYTVNTEYRNKYFIEVKLNWGIRNLCRDFDIPNQRWLVYPRDNKTGVTAGSRALIRCPIFVTVCLSYPAAGMEKSFHTNTFQQQQQNIYLWLFQRQNNFWNTSIYLASGLVTLFLFITFNCAENGAFAATKADFTEGWNRQTDCS